MRADDVINGFYGNLAIIPATAETCREEDLSRYISFEGVEVLIKEIERLCGEGVCSCYIYAYETKSGISEDCPECKGTGIR